MGNYYYSGQGSLLIAERDINGKPKGFLKVGNVPELTIDIEVNKTEHKESESGSRLIDLTLINSKNGKFKMKLENLSLDNLALGLYGTSATVALGTVTDEAVIFYKGKRVALAHPNVSSVVVKDQAELITYVAGVDYVVHAATGSLDCLTGSAILDGDELNVAYSHGAYTNLEAFTQAVAPERYLRFEGLNTVDGSHVLIDIYRGQFDPLTNYGLIQEGVAAVDMGGQILADALVTSGSQFFRQRNIAV